MKVIIHQTLHQLSGSAHRSLVTSSELFFIVNDHPITPPRTLKLPIDRVYQEYNSQAKYFVLIQVSTDKAGMDFNLSKDKREVVGAKDCFPQ
jgi:DNA mismatch repair ATPase MutL